MFRRKNTENQGFSLKGTKTNQWVKLVRSKNNPIIQQQRVAIARALSYDPDII